MITADGCTLTLCHATGFTLLHVQDRHPHDRCAGGFGGCGTGVDPLLRAEGLARRTSPFGCRIPALPPGRTHADPLHPKKGGLRGSRGYVRNHLGNAETGTTEAHDNFSVYFNMDNGTGQFRGVHLQGNRQVTPIFEAWMQPFHDLEVKTISQFSNRGTDHLSFNEAGLPGFQFLQDRIAYRARTHHFNMDTFDQLPPRDLQINAIVAASFAYHAAIRDELIPRIR